MRKLEKLSRPMSAHDLAQTPFVAAEHLEGAHVTLEIADVFTTEFDGDNLGCVEFAGAKRVLRLNRTHRECIAALFGPRTSGWIGKRLTLYPTEVRFGPDTVPAVRIAGSPDMDQDELEVTWTVHGGRRRRVSVTLKRTVVEGE